MGFIPLLIQNFALGFNSKVVHIGCVELKISADSNDYAGIQLVSGSNFSNRFNHFDVSHASIGKKILQSSHLIDGIKTGRGS